MNEPPGPLYVALGVPVDATQAEIDRAFRALLRRHHPDSRGAVEESQGARSDAALQQAFAAYSVLGDPSRRLAYDRDTAAASRAAALPPRSTAAPRYSATPARDSSRPPIVAGPVRWHPSSPDRGR